MMNDFICDFRRDGFVSKMDATDATTIAVFGMGKIWENDVDLPTFAQYVGCSFLTQNIHEENIHD